jgi:hypothetical protein
MTFHDDNGLTWIRDASKPSMMAPSDNGKSYVQDYIAEHGSRKCEANDLVVEPEIGRQLCRDAILEHIPADAVEKYQRKLDRARKQLQRALRERLA